MTKVRCVCNKKTSNTKTVECSECHTLQHVACVGEGKEPVGGLEREKYTCYSCKFDQNLKKAERETTALQEVRKEKYLSEKKKRLAAVDLLGAEVDSAVASARAVVPTKEVVPVLAEVPTAFIVNKDPFFYGKKQFLLSEQKTFYRNHKNLFQHEKSEKFLRHFNSNRYECVKKRLCKAYHAAYAIKKPETYYKK